MNKSENKNYKQPPTLSPLIELECIPKLKENSKEVPSISAKTDKLIFIGSGEDVPLSEEEFA